MNSSRQSSQEQPPLVAFMNDAHQLPITRDHRVLKSLPRLSSARLAAIASVMLFASLTLVACGGGSSTSDVVPKSTPDIIPPTNTSAEKASAQTTSTSTTSKGATGTGSSSGSTGEEAAGSESSGEPSSSEGASGSATGGPAGGTSAGEKEKAASTEGSSKAGSEASPSGGASAP